MGGDPASALRGSHSIPNLPGREAPRFLALPKPLLELAAPSAASSSLRRSPDVVHLNCCMSARVCGGPGGGAGRRSGGVPLVVHYRGGVDACPPRPARLASPCAG